MAREFDREKRQQAARCHAVISCWFGSVKPSCTGKMCVRATYLPYLPGCLNLGPSHFGELELGGRLLPSWRHLMKSIIQYWSQKENGKGASGQIPHRPWLWPRRRGAVSKSTQEHLPPVPAPMGLFLKRSAAKGIRTKNLEDLSQESQIFSFHRQSLVSQVLTKRPLQQHFKSPPPISHDDRRLPSPTS